MHRPIFVVSDMSMEASLITLPLSHVISVAKRLVLLFSFFHSNNVFHLPWCEQRSPRTQITLLYGPEEDNDGRAERASAVHISSTSSKSAECVDGTPILSLAAIAWSAYRPHMTITHTTAVTSVLQAQGRCKGGDSSATFLLTSRIEYTKERKDFLLGSVIQLITIL